MYYTQEQIDRANQADLVSFLQSQGEQLTRAGQEYRWKRHDSLTVRGNKWYRHSPVSYTHLDVYKRQRWTTCETRRTPPIPGFMTGCFPCASRYALPARISGRKPRSGK